MCLSILLLGLVGTILVQNASTSTKTIGKLVDKFLFADWQVSTSINPNENTVQRVEI